MFANFIEESFLIINTCDYSKKSTWEEQVDEISTFLKQLKHLSSRLSPEILQNKTYLNILNPKAISQVDSLNSHPIQQATQRYLLPEKIDLFPYLVKYYYRFFLEKKMSSGTKSHQPSSHRLQPLQHLHYSVSPNPTSRYNNSPVNETTSTKEAMALNKSTQCFPPLNKSRIVNLNEIITDNFLLGKEMTPSKTTQTKLPIFSEPKPIYEPRGSQNEILQIMEAQKDNHNMPLAEPPINNPMNLRKSNYFLYYQIVKRNEVMSEDVKKASEVEFSPDKRMSKKSQYFRFSHLGRESDGTKVKFSINDFSPNTRAELGFFKNTRDSLVNKFERMNSKQQPRTEDVTPKADSPFDKVQIQLKRNLTDYLPQTKIMEENEKMSIEETKGKGERPKALKFFGSGEPSEAHPKKKNLQVKERRGDSPIDSPIMRTSEDAFLSKYKDRPNLQLGSGRKHIFELKEPVKMDPQNNVWINPLKLLNRSYSANDYENNTNTNYLLTSNKRIQNLVSHQKIGISKGDLDPSPPTSPNKPRRRIFGNDMQLTIRAFSAEDSPRNVKGKENKKDGLKENYEEEKKVEEKKSKEKMNGKEEEKGFIDNEESVLIRNLDTVR